MVAERERIVPYLEADPDKRLAFIAEMETGAENTAIDWRCRVGDQVKIRLLNEMAGDHPMHHPFHVHGAGRFLVLSRDGVVKPKSDLGRTRCWCAPARPSTSCSTSPTWGREWRTAASPSTTRAECAQLRGDGMTAP
jgi:FtsP/CotA-like multicopper oxidase with cupredoxin domain